MQVSEKRKQQGSGYERELGRQNWIQLLALLLGSGATFGKLLNFSESQFSHLRDGNNTLGGFSED